MKAIKFTLFCLVITLCLLSCKKEIKSDSNEVTIEDRYFNLEKIGWKSKSYTQHIDDIKYSATEVPIQYYILKNQKEQDLVAVDSIYEENKTERIFEFTFEQEKEDNLLQEKYTGVDYTKSLKYMSFTISKDFYVVTLSNDTITCNGATIDRNYQIAPYKRVLLYFSGINPNEKIQLIYNDQLFGKGLMKFKVQHAHTPIEL